MLIDYDAATTSLSADGLLAAVEGFLTDNLVPGDRFNVVLSGGAVQWAADDWLTVGGGTIATAFDGLGTPSGFSNLTGLLAEALAFVDAVDGAGPVLLVTSSDQHGDAVVAGQLLADIEVLMPTPRPIHVADFSDRSLRTYEVDGQMYQGNAFLYESLAAQTGGRVATLDGTTPDVVLATLFAVDGHVEILDLHTTLDESGFCYDRFDIQSLTEGDAVLQVGRCQGAAPFRVEAGGTLDGVPFTQTLTRDGEDISFSDTTLVAFWTGQQLRAWEQEPWSESRVADIIALSLEQRVLSRYTAFFALEPELGGEVCGTCLDETEVVNTDIEDDTPEVASVAVTAFPNPFAGRVTIRVTLPQVTRAADVEVAIYDLMGRRVRTLPVASDGRLLTLVWDGTDAFGQPVASGVYVLVVTTPYGRHTLRLVVVRG